MTAIKLSPKMIRQTLEIGYATRNWHLTEACIVAIDGEDSDKLTVAQATEIVVAYRLGVLRGQVAVLRMLGTVDADRVRYCTAGKYSDVEIAAALS